MTMTFPIRWAQSALFALCVLTLAASAAAGQHDGSEGDPPPEHLLGFSAQSSHQQRQLEARFASQLDATNLSRWMGRLTARPHHVGSTQGSRNVEFIARQFAYWGFETEVEEFEVLFPTPIARTLQMVKPVAFTAQLNEPPIGGDSTSRVTQERLPPYNAYSIDGDVTAELVYVNYGVPADYEQLERRGVEVEGKIVIARYGGSWRGIKPKVAAQNGAIGCILYSDPRDDGYGQGDTYPAGPYRPAHGAQSGSVADMPLFPGDPLTPFVGAKPGVKRLTREEAPTLTTIPVLPISYADAQPLLEQLGGPVAPADWRGALPITYHLGPGPATVRLALTFDWKLVTAKNVIARLPGAQRPDEWIVRGNHHDAWTFGARDPVSGLVALLEEARALGGLVKDGWRPRRTIVYAAWDAEEPGLLGSTEWVEHHATELGAKVAVYINSDSNGRGFLGIGGSHSLEAFINQVARDVEDPQKQIPVIERARAERILRGSPAEREAARERLDLSISALGSGSDYSPFLQHLGIASLNLGYRGESGGGSYHSIYDSFDHYQRFGDPGFAYGVALAETAGRAVLRLAQAEVLPFEFTAFARSVSTYVDELHELLTTTREAHQELNRKLDEGVFEAASDPTLAFVPPRRKGSVPEIDLSPLHAAAERLATSAERYLPLLKSVAEGRIGTSQRNRANLQLAASERALTRQEGLPGRPWYRHFVYAPGFYTGYGVKTIPGVREAIEQEDWSLARKQVPIAAAVLLRYAQRIDQAAEFLRPEAASSLN